MNRTLKLVVDYMSKDTIFGTFLTPEESVPEYDARGFEYPVFILGAGLQIIYQAI